MNPKTLQRLLGETITLEYHQELDSTNDRALALARDGAPGGTLVIAEYQTAGRGRRGAVWTAPAGSSILCSLIVRPAQSLPPHHLAIATGVGVASGLQEQKIDARIKWPNDIIVSDRKVCGILVETTADAVVIGMGINYQVPTEAFPDGMRIPPGSLHELWDAEITREAILASVINQVTATIALVAENSITKALYAWNTMNWFRRRKVRVTGPMGVVDGDGLFLDGVKLIFHVFKDYGVVPMPLSSSVEAR